VNFRALAFLAQAVFPENTVFNILLLLSSKYSWVLLSESAHLNAYYKLLTNVKTEPLYALDKNLNSKTMLMWSARGRGYEAY